MGVLLSVAIWFGEKGLTVDEIERSEEYAHFLDHVRQREQEIKGPRRALKDYVAILFTRNLCFDVFVPNGDHIFAFTRCFA